MGLKITANREPMYHKVGLVIMVLQDMVELIYWARS